MSFFSRELGVRVDACGQVACEKMLYGPRAVYLFRCGVGELDPVVEHVIRDPVDVSVTPLASLLLLRVSCHLFALIKITLNHVIVLL